MATGFDIDLIRLSEIVLRAYVLRTCGALRSSSPAPILICLARSFLTATHQPGSGARS